MVKLFTPEYKSNGAEMVLDSKHSVSQFALSGGDNFLLNSEKFGT